MSGGSRGGERSSAYVKSCVCTRSGTRCLCSGTRPSLGPQARARRSSLHTAEQSLVVRRSRWHHGWANLREQEEPAVGSSRTDGARLAACHRSREGEAWHERKGWRSRPPSLRGRESSGLVARTSIVVAEVSRRRLASNKLGKRAPKRAAGSSERGSSSSLSPVGDTTGAGSARSDDSHVGLHRSQGGKGPAQGSG